MTEIEKGDLLKDPNPFKNMLGLIKLAFDNIEVLDSFHQEQNEKIQALQNQISVLEEKLKEQDSKIALLETNKTVVVVNPPVVNQPSKPSPKPTIQNPWDKPEGIQVWC